MKKLASLLLVMCMGILCAFAGSGISSSDPIDFDWLAGNDHPGNGNALWYKVDLSAVPDGSDILLYLNNLSTLETATVTAEPYVKLGAFQSLNEATTKQILPNRNYAMNLANSTITALNVDAVYILLKADEPVRFSAEPVEQGEKDLDCLNAPLFDYAGVTQTAADAWYRVDLTDVKADPAKTVKISVQNMATSAATVVAGFSFDCPSSGLSSYTATIAAGTTREKTLDRAMIDIVASDEVYVKVNTTQRIHIKADIVDADILPSTSVPASAIDFALNTEYTNSSEQWYKITVADLLQDKKQVELTLSNTSASLAHITADVAVSDPYTSLISRSISLGSKQILVKDLARNLIKEIENNTYVWVRLRSDAPVTFSARLKNRTEGTACRSAKVFDWTLGAMQNAESSLWYAVGITDAKSLVNGDKDILVTVENLSSSVATLSASVAFDCPCSATTDFTRTIAAGATIEKRLENALYSNLTTDTVFIGLTTDRNIRITAKLVPSVASDNDCASSVTFDWKNGHHQTAGKTWYYVDLSPVWAMNDTVPQIVVVNEGTGVATVSGELSFDCPGKNAVTRLMKLSAGEEYVKAVTRDMLESLSNPELYIGVDTDQPLHIYVNLQKENQGLSCRTGVDFDWEKGHTQKASSTVWYKIGLTRVKETAPLAATVGIINKDAQAGNVTADIYFDCNSDPVATYSMNLGASGKREVKLERATILSLKPDTVYLCLTTAQTDSVYAFTYDDTPMTPIEACDGAELLEYNVDIPQSAGEQWYKMSVYHLQNFTSGDATVKVTNGAEANTITAEVAFECPVVSPMTDRTKTFAALQSYSKVFSRALIDNIAGDTVYVRVISSKDFSFRVELSDERGQVCSAPILFDWDNGNIHPADKTLWYKVNLDTLRNNPDKDFQLNVENLADNSISASAEIHFDCDDEPLASFNYNFAPNELKYKIVDRTFMEQMGWPIMLIKFSSTGGDAHITAELVDALPDKRDTLIVDTVTCKGNTDFQIIQTGSIHTVVTDTTLVDSLRFTYTDGPLTMQGDSIIIYNVRVLHTAPAQYPAELLALPIIAGKAIDVTTAHTAVLNALDSYTGSTPNPVSGLDSLYSPIASLVWQQQLVEGGPFVPLNTTALLDTRTKMVTLRYRYETECQGGGASTAMQIPADEPLRETLEIAEIVENGTSFTTRTGKIFTITEDTVINDTVFNLPHDEYTLKDSVYHYTITLDRGIEHLIKDTVCMGDTYTPVYGTQRQINENTSWTETEHTAAGKHIYKYDIRVKSTAPAQYPSELTTLSVTAGKAVDIAEAETAVLNALNSYVASVPDPVSGLDSVYAEVTTLSWEQQAADGSLFAPLSSNLLDTRTKSVVLRYTYTTECGVSRTSSIVALEAAEPLRETVEIAEIVENGTSFTTRTGQSFTITKDTLVSDTVFNLVHDATTLKDSVYNYKFTLYIPVEKNIMDTVCAGSVYTPEYGTPAQINKDTTWTEIEYAGTEKRIYNYSVFVYTLPTTSALPDETSFVLPIAVCGQPVATAAATTSLESALLQRRTAGDFTAPVSAVLWELQLGTEWKRINVAEPVVKNMDDVNVRYLVVTACDDTIRSKAFTLVVEEPTADNVAEYADMPAVSKYDGWLLMINLNAINAKGWNPTEEQVKWFRVVGQLDNASNGETDDEFLSTGYYYTNGEKLIGDYYATIGWGITQDDPCGATLRTVTLTCADEASTASLAPSVVSPGEIIEIKGLDPMENYSLDIYNLAGVVVETITLNSEEDHNIKAQTTPGYYMVKVKGAGQWQTLKYIVK